MKEKIETALNNQLNSEFFSAYLYLAMAAYFESLNLKGFAHWMKIQAQEELGHATRVYNHINERKMRVVLTKIGAPVKTWASPAAAIDAAFKHEKGVTALINKMVNLAQQTEDHASKSILQWFVDEQVEEEGSFNDLLEKMKMVKDSKGGLLMLDHGLSKRKAE